MKTWNLGVLLLTAGVVLAADKPAVKDLLAMAATTPDAETLRQGLLAWVKPEDVKTGKAVIGELSNFLWVVESETQPVLVVDGEARGGMRHSEGSNLWIAIGKLEQGDSHKFHYLIGGKEFGGRNDVAAYLPESYEMAGVPQGKVTDKLIHRSTIYPGMETNYWVYIPAQYDRTKPLALMVWQDGEKYVDRNGAGRMGIVVDNLIAQKKIPPMILVLISPGTVGEKKMRSIEYDTVNDTYPRFLRDELLAEVEAKYKIRKDSYSRAIAGESSGGICSFNAAWFMPEQFSRVLSRIGSFTSIQWKPNVLDGGQSYPNKIRKEPKRNIRVWLSDGAEDLENEHGSWPLQNVQMANSLKRMGFDYRFHWGVGTHSTAQGNAELPTAMTWLWRDYDADKTGQEYVQDDAEKAKGLWRVKALSRD
jgi:enterochelin esterase-like enzyme